jgi:hypothetical protein
MTARGELTIDPASLDPLGGSGLMQLVVVHSEPLLTANVLKRAADLVAGLSANILLLAVHTVPFPAPFASASASHAHLVGELAKLAGQCPLAVTPHVVMARYRDEGFRFLLQRESTVLVGSRRRRWRNREEKLARVLARDGHNVILFHIA